MLAEKRFHQVLKLLEERSFVTNEELVKTLGVSESTVRRDLAYLDSIGEIKRVHGGAALPQPKYGSSDESISVRRTSNMDQKCRIAQYAASLIEDDDFIFVDCGTTTEQMIESMTARNVSCVTNSIIIARAAAVKCKRVFLIGGEFKIVTEAIVGPNAVEDLKKYNFLKGFFGANAVNLSGGYTTPDVNEAMVKRQAFNRTIQRYVLADPSKMNRVTSFTFGNLQDAILITTHMPNEDILHATTVIEVDTLKLQEGGK